MANNPAIWFEIYVKDMNRAKRFYEGVLGVTLDRLDSPDKDLEMWSFPSDPDGPGASGLDSPDKDLEMWSFPSDPDGPGASGALARMEGGPSGGGTSTIVYFSCEDCAVQAGRVAAHGGTLMKDKFSIGQHGFIALATDTEQNVIGFHSMR